MKVKHPIMRGREKDVIKTLKEPDFIRQNRKDTSVYLYYPDLLPALKGEGSDEFPTNGREDVSKANI